MKRIIRQLWSNTKVYEFSDIQVIHEAFTLLSYRGISLCLIVDFIS